MGDEVQPQAQALRPASIARHAQEFSISKHNYPIWAKQFRNYCELLQVQENQLDRTLLSFLDPELFTIAEYLALTQAHRANIFADEPARLIKNALCQRETKIPPGYELKSRKQGENESITKFASELEKLALEAYPNEQKIRQNRVLIQSFISGGKRLISY